MKASYQTRNGQVTFELEGQDIKDVFRQLAKVQEVFDAEAQCGMCESKDIRFLARKVEDFDFYELDCQKCHAHFSFGQAKKGGALFPKRRDENGAPLPHDGWSRYERPGGQTQATPSTAMEVTPEMQEVFDRIAVAIEVRPPVTVEAAFAILRNEMRHSMGPVGEAEFDKLKSRAEKSGALASPAGIIQTLREIWKSYSALRKGVA